MTTTINPTISSAQPAIQAAVEQGRAEQARVRGIGKQIDADAQRAIDAIDAYAAKFGRMK